MGVAIARTQGAPIVVLSGDRGRGSAASSAALRLSHYFAKPSYA